MSDEKLRAEWFWTDRWLASDAFLLPIEARGLYREMLTRAWSFGGYLPNDHEAIKRLVNASDAEWKRCWPLIEANWKQDGSKLYNATQREVLMGSLTLREKRALAGQKGGVASGKARSKPEANAEATPEANPKQTNPLSLSLSLSPDAGTTTTDSPKSGGNGRVRKPRKTRRTYSESFLRFWRLYPRKKSKGDAFDAWQALGCDEIADEIVAYLNTEQWDWRDGGKWNPYPATWLRAEGWGNEDDSIQDPDTGEVIERPGR